jgi:uncharacterized protein (TIGR02679 family)
MTELPVRFDRPELAVLWRQARRAMEAAGPRWNEVRISVPVGDDDQRRALAGLLRRVVRTGTASVGVRLADLDAILRRPGDGWTLRAVVEEVGGGPLVDRRGDAVRLAAAVDGEVDAARQSGPGEAWFEAWLTELVADGTATRLARRGDGGLLTLAASVVVALPVPMPGEPLPAVSARLTGDTKALASGPLAGLVLRAIATWLAEPRARDAASRRALWEAVGVVPDDLASQVLVLNLPVQPSPGLGSWLADAAERGLPFRATLHQLTRSPVTLARAAPVYVCENPAIVRAAAEQLGPRSPPLVCTEGRPSLAAVRLLDVLATGGAALHVRADFDWPGLRIAGSLLDRPGSQPWRFGVTDYEAARLRRDGRPPVRLAPDDAAPSPWDPTLAAVMARAGEAVFEEELLDELLGDLAGR